MTADTQSSLNHRSPAALAAGLGIVGFLSSYDYFGTAGAIIVGILSAALVLYLDSRIESKHSTPRWASDEFRVIENQLLGITALLREPIEIAGRLHELSAANSEAHRSQVARDLSEVRERLRKAIEESEIQGAAPHGVPWWIHKDLIVDMPTGVPIGPDIDSRSKLPALWQGKDLDAVFDLRLRKPYFVQTARGWSPDVDPLVLRTSTEAETDHGFGSGSYGFFVSPDQPTQPEPRATIEWIRFPDLSGTIPEVDNRDSEETD